MWTETRIKVLVPNTPKLSVLPTCTSSNISILS